MTDINNSSSHTVQNHTLCVCSTFYLKGKKKSKTAGDKVDVDIHKNLHKIIQAIEYAQIGIIKLLQNNIYNY